MNPISFAADFFYIYDSEGSILCLILISTPVQI